MNSSTLDITGKVIKLGDRIAYDFDDAIDQEEFTVIFENNALRKKYDDWDETLEKPILEFGDHAKEMRLKITNKQSSTMR